MSFLNGLINTRNLLLISLFFSIIASSIIFVKLVNIKLDKIQFDCFTDHETLRSYKNLKEFQQICNEVDTQVRNNFKILSFELDNHTYIKNFAQMNLLEYEKKKIFNKMIPKETFEIIDYINKSQYRFNFSSEKFLSFSTDQKKILIIDWLIDNKIKQEHFIKPFSSLYTKFFSTNDKIYQFFYSFNLILFIFAVFFLYYSIRDIFEFSREISILISLNAIFFPIFIIYFLSFYKEPYILTCFLSLVANVIYLFKKKFFSLNELSKFVFFTISISVLFILLKHIKNEYFFLFFLSFLICFFFTILFTKKLKNSLFAILQMFIFLFIFIDFSFQFNITNNFYQKINIPNINLEKKILKELDIKENIYLNLEKEKIIKKKSNEEKEVYFVTPSIEKKSASKFKDFECNHINTFYCKKINNLAFKIYSIKHATLHENIDYNNKNIVNERRFAGTLDVYSSVPVSTLKGYFMPILFNNNNFVAVLSIYKICTGLIFVALTSYFIFFQKQSLQKKKLTILTIFLFAPLSLSVDLIASNYFTYFRYVYPINVFILIMIISFIVKLYQIKIND